MAAIPAPLLRLFAPLDALLRDEQVSKILVDGADRVFVEREGRVVRAPVHYSSRALSDSLDGLARRARKPFDEQRPYLEALLKDGTRFLAIRPPAVKGGPLLSITRPSGGGGEPTLTLARLLPQPLRPFLRAALDRGLNIAVVGPAATGRARVLEAITALLPEIARVVVVEEFPELDFGEREVVRLVPRRVEGDGGVTTGELLYCAGRMSADRVCLNEVKRADAWDVVSLLAERMAPMAVALPGATSGDALARLEALARAAATAPRDRAVAGLLGAGLDITLVLGQDQRVREVHSVRCHEGQVSVELAFSWQGGVSGQLVATPHAAALEAEWTGRQISSQAAQPAVVPQMPGGPATLNGPPMASMLSEARGLSSLIEDAPADPGAIASPSAQTVAQPSTPRVNTRDVEQPTAQVPIPDIPDDLLGPVMTPSLGPPTPTGSEADFPNGSASIAPEIPGSVHDSMDDMPMVGRPLPSDSGARPSSDLRADESGDQDADDADSIMVQYDPSMGSIDSVHDTEVAKTDRRSGQDLADASSDGSQSSDITPSSRAALPQGLAALSAGDDSDASHDGSSESIETSAGRVDEVGAGDSLAPTTVPVSRRRRGATRPQDAENNASSPPSEEKAATPAPTPVPEEPVPEEEVSLSRTTAVRPIVGALRPTGPIVIEGDASIDPASMAGTMQIAKVGNELAPTTVHDVIDDDALRLALGRLPEDDEDDLTEGMPNPSSDRGPTAEVKEAPRPDAALDDPALSKKTFSQVLKNIREDDSGSLSGSVWPQVDTETSDMPEALSDPRHRIGKGDDSL
ncbi:MAG: ATPase, T2SS/T4P/T4SS family [Bradymonadia bacterium]